MKKSATSKRYSEAFKRQAVTEIESGRMTIGDVRRKYAVSGSATVLGWLKRYGTGKAVGTGSVRDETVTARRKLLVLEREKRELEAALARTMVEKVGLEGLIDEAEAQLGISIKKNFGKGR